MSNDTFSGINNDPRFAAFAGEREPTLEEVLATIRAERQAEQAAGAPFDPEAEVAVEIVANELMGDESSLEWWKRSHRSQWAYRVALKRQEYEDSQRAGPDEAIAQLQLNVAAAAAGGSVRRDGTVQGVNRTFRAPTAQAPAGRFVKMRNTANKFLDTGERNRVVSRKFIESQGLTHLITGDDS